MGEPRAPGQTQPEPEPAPWQPQGQRTAAVLQPRAAQARQDGWQPVLEPGRVLAWIRELQQGLDICRRQNRESLAQLQRQESAAEREQRDLALLLQRCQALMEQVLCYEATLRRHSPGPQLPPEAPGSEQDPEQSEALLSRAGELEEQEPCRAQERPDTSGQAEAQAEAKHGRQEGPAAEKLQGLARDAQPARAAERSSAMEAPAQLLLARSCPPRAEAPPCPCLGRDVQCQASCELEAELRALQEQAARSRAEVTQSREAAAQLQAELSWWQQQQQTTLEQALQHRHATAQAEERLQRSQEQLQALKQQCQEQAAMRRELHEELCWQQDRREKLQLELQEAKEWTSTLEKENRALQQSLRCREQALGEQEELSQGLQCHLLRLQEELGATHAREQQSQRQLHGAEETIHALQQEVASNRKHLAELLGQVQDMPSLRAELAQAQQGKAKQEEEIAAYKEQRQQLHWELRKLQGSQEQSKQEAHSLETRLQELSSRAQQWQQLHQDSERALATREEELVVCKVELAFLKEKLSKALEQKEALQHEINMLRQKFAATSAEAEALRSSLTAARSDSSRLHRESELVLVNISQWVKKQKQSNEKLGQKIQQQVKQIAELTGKKEQLQNTLGRLQEENKYLRVRADEQHRECEHLKASRAPVTARPETVLGLCSCV